MDQTSLIQPKGGINKDTLKSNHGFLHRDAAGLAIAATGDLLEDIRMAAGHRPFLEYVCATVHISPSLSAFYSFALSPPGCWEFPEDPARLWVSSSTPPKA